MWTIRDRAQCRPQCKMCSAWVKPEFGNITHRQVDALNEELLVRQLIMDFFNQTDEFKQVKQSCALLSEQYPAEQYPALLLSLRLDYEQLRSEHQRLLQLLTREPNYCAKVFGEIVLSAANSVLAYMDSQLALRPEQVYCRLRVKLPLEDRFLFLAGSSNVPLGLTVLHCVVQGFSGPQKYILQSLWHCVEHCSQIAITAEVRKPPRCEICGRSLQERERNRSMSDFRTARVLLAKSVRTPILAGVIHQSILVRLADDLCQTLKLGYEYAITGVFNPFNQIFNAWSFTEL